MGVYLRTLRPGKVIETTVIGVALLLFRWCPQLGGRLELGGHVHPQPRTLVIWLVVYGFAASVLPVWMLLAPRTTVHLHEGWHHRPAAISVLIARAGAEQRGRHQSSLFRRRSGVSRVAVSRSSHHHRLRALSDSTH